MSVHITYFVHGTTTDNEYNRSTGWNPGELSVLGIQQAKELGDLVRNSRFDVFFCSDLKRAIDSARLGFGKMHDIIQDKKLRECNYGDLNGSSPEVDYYERIDSPFPNGESMKDVERRIQNFLEDLKKNYDGKYIAVLAHKAPQLALEVLLKGKTWKQALDEDWRNTKSWQPGWEYVLT